MKPNVACKWPKLRSKDVRRRKSAVNRSLSAQNGRLPVPLKLAVVKKRFKSNRPKKSLTLVRTVKQDVRQSTNSVGMHLRQNKWSQLMSLPSRKLRRLRTSLVSRQLTLISTVSQETSPSRHFLSEPRKSSLMKSAKRKKRSSCLKREFSRRSKTTKLKRSARRKKIESHKRC